MEQPARPLGWRTPLGVGALLALLVGMGVRLNDMSGRVDEGEHVEQILRLVRGEWTINPVLTTVPGFHALIAAVVHLTGLQTVEAMRADALGFALAAVVAFAACAHALAPDRAVVRTWTWALFPILTPFLFLIYTDLTSLLFVLLALFASVRGRHGFAGLATIASMAVRQNNVLWLGFFLALALTDTTTPRPKREWLWVYLLGFAAFAAFVVVNGGVAVGDQPSHPFPDVHASNVYFLLSLHFVFFLPEHVARAADVVALVRSQRWIGGALAVGFPLFVLTFTNTHALNTGSEQDMFFLRNQLLGWLVGPLDHMAVAYAAVAWTVLSLAVTPLVRPQYLLLYPFTVLFLVPSWLVEQRYTLIPFTLFLLMRRPASARVELATWLWMLPFTAYFLWGIEAGRFFL